MTRNLRLQVLSAMLIAVLLVAIVPPMTPPASANPGGFREVVAVFRLFSAGHARNRVYREARELQGDMNAYYEKLRDTARQRLLDREVTPLSRSQLAAYLKLVEQIEGERNAATNLIEGEKRAARARFNRTLRRELLGALIRSPFGRRMMSDVRGVFAETRAAVAQLRTALEMGNPTEALLSSLEQRIAGIGPLRGVIRSVGGTSGAGLLLQLGRAGDLLQTVVDTASAGQSFAADAENILAEIDNGLERETARARRVRSGAALSSALDNLFVAVTDEVSVDAVAQAVGTTLRDELAALMGQTSGSLSERQIGTMQQRVRAALLEDRTQRIADLAEYMECEKVAGRQFREFVEELGRPAKLARLASGISEEDDDQLYMLCAAIRGDEILSAVLLVLEEGDDESTTGVTEVVSEAIEIVGSWDMYNIGSDGVERHAYTIVLAGGSSEGSVDVVQDDTDFGTYTVEDGQIRLEFTRRLDLDEFGPWDETSKFAGAVIDEATIRGEYVRQGWSCLPDRDPPCADDPVPVVFESRLERRP